MPGKKWKEAREQIELGKDPAAEKQVAKRTAQVRARTTFAHVAAEVIIRLRQEGKARSTIRKHLWLLRVLAKDLRHRPVADITAPEILAVLQQATKRGRLESARRLRAAIRQVMRLAVATNRATVDPTPALRGLIPAPRVKHRAAVTTPAAAGKLMDAIWSVPMSEMGGRRVQECGSRGRRGCSRPQSLLLTRQRSAPRRRHRASA